MFKHRLISRIFPSSSSSIKWSFERFPIERFFFSTESKASTEMLSVYLETWGCQMSFNDSEIVLGILKTTGKFKRVTEPSQASIALLMGCSIRESAESKVHQRIDELAALRSRNRPLTIAVLGCMAERLKEALLQPKGRVNLVCGPDAYRDLPRLLEIVAEQGAPSAINVQLSLEETYADVAAVRLNPRIASAHVSIMRGCNNMCAFCIVPWTRGRERSRPMDSILREVRRLHEQEGVLEVLLLGQNVNSYRGERISTKESSLVPTEEDEEFVNSANENPEGTHTYANIKTMIRGDEVHGQVSNNLHSQEINEIHSPPVYDSNSQSSNGSLSQANESTSQMYFDLHSEQSNQPPFIGAFSLTPGFKTIVPAARLPSPQSTASFAELLFELSRTFPQVRFKFTSPHPKDFPLELLQVIAQQPNICKHIHLPAQSGSSSVLERMRRGYTREAYLNLVDRILNTIPSVTLSSDFIVGFCGETEEEHQESLSLIREVPYDMAFMFAYSMRERTHAHRSMQDDVPGEVKQRRLREMQDLFYGLQSARTKDRWIGKEVEVLVEGRAKKQPWRWMGMSANNRPVIFDAREENVEGELLGKIVKLKVIDTSGGTLIGQREALESENLVHNVELKH